LLFGARDAGDENVDSCQGRDKSFVGGRDGERVDGESEGGEEGVGGVGEGCWTG